MSKQSNMFSPDFREVLKNLTNITNSFIVQNQMVFTDEFQQIVVAVDAKKLGEDFDQSIPINEMTGFLSTVNLFEEPEISIKDRIINIKDESSKAKYLTSDIKSMKKVDYKIIESTKKVDTVLTFDITEDILNKIKSAASVLKDANSLTINNSDSLELIIGNTSSFEALNNSFTIKIDDYSGSIEKSINIPLESVLKLPVADYKVQVKHNKEKDAYRVYMENPILEVVLSISK